MGLDVVIDAGQRARGTDRYARVASRQGYVRRPSMPLGQADI